MSNPDYTTAITVDQTAKEAFDAINNVRGWWSEQIEGSTDKLGDDFTYRYKNIHCCKIKLGERGFDKTGPQVRHRNICEIEIEQDPG